MPRNLTFLALCLGAAVLLEAGRAEAFCRSSVCKTQDGSTRGGKVCFPNTPNDCGTPLHWARPCVSFSIQKKASTQINLADAEEAAGAAFASWTQAACAAAGSPHIELTELSPTNCDAVEYNQHRGNANLIVFRDDEWPHPSDATIETFALTTVTFDTDTGEIVDADIEVNTAQNHFTLGDTAVDADLLSVLTHEAGHFLGLSHTPAADATMYPEYMLGDTSQRTLADDDIAGICASYPPGEPITLCNLTPKHGFADPCAAPPPEDVSFGGCGCRAAPSGGLFAAAALAFAGALALGVRRRA